MEQTTQRTVRPPSLVNRRDKKAIVHRRIPGSSVAYVPKIRAVGEVNVRELLGRDEIEDVSPVHDCADY